MNEKVLLVNPNRMKPAVAPVALDYLASALTRQGFQTDVLDLCFSNNWAEDIDGYFAANHPVAVGISLRNTDDTSLGSQEFFIPGFKEITDYIRGKTSVPVILGGAGFSLMPELILDYLGLDLGITGDGEYSLPLLVNKLVSRQDYRQIPGLVYRLDGSLHRNSPASPNLDDIIIPGRRWIDNRRYFVEGGMGAIESKRGCNMGCIYCADPLIKGKSVRLRSPRKVVDEIEELLSLGIDHFHFCDSEFNVPMLHADEVCVEIIRRRLGNRIKWYAYANPGRFTMDLAAIFKKAGCAGLNFGVDSGSERMLHKMGRDFKLEQVRNTAGFCYWIGIVFMYDLLLGGPGETRDSLKETITLMKDINPYRVGATLGVRVLPGTALADIVRKEGPVHQNPNLQGCTDNNEDFFFPVFYLSSALGEDAQGYLAELIAGDERFFLMSPREEGNRDYNYNENHLLVEAIGAGYRGAFWDILRRSSAEKQDDKQRELRS